MQKQQQGTRRQGDAVREGGGEVARAGRDRNPGRLRPSKRLEAHRGLRGFGSVCTRYVGKNALKSNVIGTNMLFFVKKF